MGPKKKKINKAFLLLMREYVNEFDIHHYYHLSNQENKRNKRKKKTMGDFLPFDIRQYPREKI